MKAIHNVVNIDALLFPVVLYLKDTLKMKAIHNAHVIDEAMKAVVLHSKDTAIENLK